ncbi:hypothetical protein JCM16303_004702 [Sporobolomyces ruberrimus]
MPAPPQEASVSQTQGAVPPRTSAVPHQTSVPPPPHRSIVSPRHDALPPPVANPAPALASLPSHTRTEPQLPPSRPPISVADSLSQVSFDQSMVPALRQVAQHFSFPPVRASSSTTTSQPRRPHRAPIPPRKNPYLQPPRPNSTSLSTPTNVLSQDPTRPNSLPPAPPAADPDPDPWQTTSLIRKLYPNSSPSPPIPISPPPSSSGGCEKKRLLSRRRVRLEKLRQKKGKINVSSGDEGDSSGEGSEGGKVETSDEEGMPEPF